MYNYFIGDILVIIRTFSLTDIYMHRYYYNVGDEFTIVEIDYEFPQAYNKNPALEFMLKSRDSIFKWTIDIKDMKEDFEQDLVPKKNFKKFLRKMKLETLK